MKCDVCNTEYKPADGGGNNTANSGGGAVPVGTVAGFPLGQITNNGMRHNSAGDVLAQGVYYAFGGAGAAGPKKLSFAIDSGGYPVYVGFDLNAMKNDGVGGSNWHNAPTDGNDWTFYVMYTADPGRVQSGHIDMLDA
jgi:hypothetical protein